MLHVNYRFFANITECTKIICKKNELLIKILYIASNYKKNIYNDPNNYIFTFSVHIIFIVCGNYGRRRRAGRQRRY